MPVFARSLLNRVTASFLLLKESHLFAEPLFPKPANEARAARSRKRVASLSARGGDVACRGSRSAYNESK